MVLRVYIYLFAVLLFLSACQQKGKNNAPDKVAGQGASAYNNTPPAFGFQEELHYFGELKQGEVVSYTFVFENRGGNDLIINGVEAGCGCTTVKWPEQPIHPGDSGHIEVILDTSGEYGNLYKIIVLHANIEKKREKLIITAIVET